MSRRVLVAALPVAAVAIAACFGDDSTGSAPDASINVEPDASMTTDGSVIADAFADTRVPDSAPIEASTVDAAPDAPDATPDATADAASDAAADAAPDAATVDAGDAGPCVGVDAGALGYRETVLADNPLAYWRLGEASGTAAVDETGHVTDMTYTGGPTLGVPGAIANDTNTAVSFNGTSSYAQSVSAPFDFAPSLPFSIELWLMPTANQTGYPRLMSREFADGIPADREGFLLTWSASSVGQERLTDAGDIAVESPPIVPIGSYSHVVTTFDGTTTILYVNGVAVATTPGAGAMASITQAFALAGFPYGVYPDFFEGTLDEVAVYAGALPASRALVHYCVGAGR